MSGNDSYDSDYEEHVVREVERYDEMYLTNLAEAKRALAVGIGNGDEQDAAWRALRKASVGLTQGFSKVIEYNHEKEHGLPTDGMYRSHPRVSLTKDFSSFEDWTPKRRSMFAQHPQFVSKMDELSSLRKKIETSVVLPRVLEMKKDDKDRYDDEISLAMELFEAGFKTQMSKNTALSALARAHDPLSSSVYRHYNSGYLANRHPKWKKLHNLPHAYSWSDKHRETWSEHPEIVERMDKLNELRKAIADAPVAPPAPKSGEKERLEATLEQIKRLMAKREIQFLDGYELLVVGDGLKVTVNAHWVVNQYGTKFLRHYFYLNGALTPYSVIDRLRGKAMILSSQELP